MRDLMLFLVCNATASEVVWSWNGKRHLEFAQPRRSEM